MSKHIILVRHGEVPGIAPPRFRGRTQLPLTPRGVEQAARTATYLCATSEAGAIWAGPLDRCQRTAQAIAGAQGLAPRTVAALNDIDYGQWQGQSYAEVRTLDPTGFEGWMTRPDGARIPGAETLQQVTMRAIAAVEAALADAAATLIFVSHDSVNRLILLHVLGLPPSQYHALEQAPCAVSRLHTDGARWRVTSMNETAHLVPPG
jgi:broad specificity phosphatase PhoE